MEIDVDAEAIGFQPTPAEQTQLHEGLHRAQIEAARILVAQVKGEYDKAVALDPLFSDIDIFGQSRATLEPLPNAGIQTDTINVSEAATRYCALKAVNAWSAKTLSENERVLSLFQQSLGSDRTLKSVSTADVRNFRNTLRKLPSNYVKMKGHAGKSLADVIASADGQPVLATRTARKYLHNLRAFLRWTNEEGYLDSIPGLGIKIEGLSASQARDARHSYSDESLQKLFTSPQYLGHRSNTTRAKPGNMLIKDGKFWVPLIGLFAGMRMGEIVQLLVADIRTEDGVPFFDITIREGEDKQLKTDASRRKVPIHPQLIRMGLLKYRANLDAGKAGGRLFPEIERGADGYFSHNFSKWFSRYAKQIGIKSAKTVFHSLRHNFKDALEAAGVEEARRRALMGHTNSTVHGGYGSALPVSLLAEDIKRLSWNISFEHLYEP